MQSSTPEISYDPLYLSSRQAIMSVARSSLPLLLVGGNREKCEGTARVMHVGSERADGPFIMTRCGLYRGALLEKRFFGRAAGGTRSYIRTVDRQMGQIELADGGTLYVDQIQHATALMQDRLLQALSEGTFVDPITGDLLAADVRIIASTSISPKACAMRLLPELAARLNVLTLQFSPAKSAIAARIVS